MVEGCEEEDVLLKTSLDSRAPPTGWELPQEHRHQDGEQQPTCLPPNLFAAKCPIDAREAGAGWRGKSGMSGKSGMVGRGGAGQPKKGSSSCVLDSTAAGGGFGCISN